MDPTWGRHGHEQYIVFELCYYDGPLPFLRGPYTHTSTSIGDKLFSLHLASFMAGNRILSISKERRRVELCEHGLDRWNCISRASSCGI